MAGFFNKFWSGLDFWQKKENQAQRQQFSREDEEERKRRALQAVQKPQPTNTGRPSYVQDSAPVYDPSTPLKKVGSQSQFAKEPLNAMGIQPPQQPKPEAPKTPEQILAENKTKTLDDLAAANYKEARREAEKNESWVGRNILNRKAIEERAVAGARTKAVNQYQERNNWANDPTVTEYSKDTRYRLEKAPIAGEGQKLLAPVLSAGRVGTGIVEGGAGLYDLATPGKGQNRVTQAATKKAQDIDQLAKDMGTETAYKGLNVPLEILTYFTPGVAAKGGKAAGLTEKVAKTVGLKADEADDVLKGAPKLQKFVREGIDEFLDPKNLEQEANLTGRYMGQDSAKGEAITGENVAENVGQSVAGAFLPAFLRRGLQKFRGGDEAVEEGAELAAGRLLDKADEVEQPKLPPVEETGPRDTVVSDGTPAKEVATGIKSTNIPKEIDTPAYQRRQAETVGQAQTGYNMGINNVDDSIFDADARIKATPEIPSVADDYYDIPAYMRQDPAASSDEAISGLQAIDEEIAAVRAGLLNDPSLAPRLNQLLIDRQRVASQLDQAIQARGPAPVDVPPPVIPDPTSNFALAKVDSGIPAVVDDGVPLANFDEAVDGSALQKAEVGPVSDVDVNGNPILRSDAQVAQEMGDEGLAPARGESPLADSENTLDEAAAEATDQQVATGAEVLLKALDDAQGSYDEVAAARRGERAERIGAGRGAYESAGGGEQGYRAKIAQLKGKYAESGFQPVGIDEGTQINMLDAVENSDLRDFEKLTAQRGLRKIWGAGEGKPVPSELELIRRVFGEDGDKIVDAVEEAIAQSPKGWKERLVDIAGIPRTAMTAFDLSMGLRQGSGVMFTNFPEWARANRESVKYMFNPKYFDEAMSAMKADDAYTLVTDKMGVRLPSVEDKADELMSSTDVLEKIPVYGKGVEGSNRAYSGGLTNLRYNVAKKWVEALGGVDEAAKLSDQELKDIGEVVNTFTGSGGKSGGVMERNMEILSSTLFAPRLWASRLNMLNPRFYQRLSPQARNQALKNAASFMGAAAATVGLLEYTLGDKVDVETDPRSSDFMKLKFGNTRYDIFSGLQQNIVLAARLATGEKKSSETGEIETLGDGYGKPSRFDVAMDALQNKFNPVLGLASKFMQSGNDDESDNPLDRKDRFGQEFNVGTEAAKMGVPLGVLGAKETYDDTGDLKKTAAMTAPGFVGVGVQTYGTTPTKDGAKSADAKDMKAIKKELDAEGIPTQAEKITDLGKTGDYDKALRGAEYRLRELENDKTATDNAKNNLRKDIEDYRFGQQYGYMPSSNEAVETRAEKGDYEGAIAGWKVRLQRDEAEGNTPDSKLETQRRKIQRYEIFKEANVSPDMVTAYEKDSAENGGVGVTAWRDMMDSGEPELVAYAEQLYNLDKALVDAGSVSKAKYYWGKGGRGGSGGGRGSSPRFVTDIATQNAKSFTFTPQKAQQASFSAPKSAIPKLEKVANNDTSKLKKVSVRRGGRV